MSAEAISRRGRYAVLVAGLLAALFVAGSYAVPYLPEAPGRVLGWLYAPLCHQMAERSIAVGPGVQAVCARCAGLYLGGVAGLLVAAACLGLLSRRLRPWMFALAIAPTLIDALLPWAGLPALETVPRLLLAVPAGAMCGLFLAVGIADLAENGATKNLIPAARRRKTLEVVDG